jgi:hypothetical protein
VRFEQKHTIGFKQSEALIEILLQSVLGVPVERGIISERRHYVIFSPWLEIFKIPIGKRYIQAPHIVGEQNYDFVDLEIIFDAINAFRCLGQSTQLRG